MRNLPACATLLCYLLSLCCHTAMIKWSENLEFEPENKLEEFETTNALDTFMFRFLTAAVFVCVDWDLLDFGAEIGRFVTWRPWGAMHKIAQQYIYKFKNISCIFQLVLFKIEIGWQCSWFSFIKRDISPRNLELQNKTLKDALQYLEWWDAIYLRVLKYTGHVLMRFLYIVYHL